MKKLLSLLMIITLISCFNTSNENDYKDEEFENETEYNSFSSSSSDVDVSEDEFDGNYNAEVNYFNPETGTKSAYTLEVEVENGELTIIHWPNGGWLDSSHFSPVDISSGSASFASDEGYEYEVRLLDKLD